MSTQLHAVCPHCQAINRLSKDKLNAAPNCGKCKSALFTGVPFDVNQAQFDRQVNKGDVPVLVDFWASWCGPCKMMAPEFKQAASVLEPHVRLLKVNTETEQGIAARYNIRSIPTLMLFKNGKAIATQPGAMQAKQIVQWTQAAL